MVLVAIALRIAIASEHISFYSTVVKSAASCIIAMLVFKVLLMWRGPILLAALSIHQPGLFSAHRRRYYSPFPGALSRTGPALCPVLD